MARNCVVVPIGPIERVAIRWRPRIWEFILGSGSRGGTGQCERGFPHFSRYQPDLQNSASIRKLADSLCSGLLRRGFTLAELQPLLGSQLWWVSHLMCIEEAPMTSDERLLRTWERIAEEATHSKTRRN